MKNIILPLITMTFIINGCSNFDTKPLAWKHKKHHNSQLFYKDNSQCLSMSGKASTPVIIPNPYRSYGTGFAAGMQNGFTNNYNALNAANTQRTRNTIYTQCMYGKGYYQE